MAKFPTTAKRSFGPPPPLDETHGNLAAPEVAPAAPAPIHTPKTRGARRGRKQAAQSFFSTRVSEEFDRDFRATAERDNLLLTRLLELAFDAYRKQKGD